MCGRFVSSSTPSEIARYFDAVPPAPEVALEPSWNVAPTNDIYTVVEVAQARHVAPFHWGLVPFWAKDPSIGNKMINARSDMLSQKNAYKNAFRKRRCIVPADGFYEWKAVTGQKTKQPYFIHRADGEMLAFAGLWEEWRGDNRDQPPLRSVTIITTDANATMEPIHHRMPVILPPSAWADWLDPEHQDGAALSDLLVPAPACLLEIYPVGREVGNVRNGGPQLIERVPVPPTPDAMVE